MYYSDFLSKCIACSANCLTCTDKKTCSSCASPFTLTSGVCTCDGFRNINLNCVICPDVAYTYYDGSACLACPDNCEDCDSPSGYCNSCASGFVVSDDGTCGCDLGWYLSGGVCVEATATCSDGYYNDGEDNCVSCGSGCATCTAYTGACETCTDSSYTVSGLTCSNCAYEIGPVDAPTQCLDTAYSSTRVIPPFASSSTSVDWRDWDIVNEI